MKKSGIVNWEKHIEKKGYHDWRYYKPYVANCIKYGMPGKILDIGTGLGGFVECCTRYRLECIGLEADGWAVNEAKRRASIDIRQYHIEDGLPFTNEEFSIIFTNQVIEHLPAENARFMLKECYRVLKNDGSLFIFSPCYYDKKERADEKHINLYTPSRLQEEVTKAGFKIIIPMNFPLFLLGESLIGKLIMGMVFMLFPVDRLSDTASLIAYKTKNKKEKIFRNSYFHIQKMIHH